MTETNTKSCYSIVAYRSLEKQSHCLSNYISPLFAKVEQLKTSYNEDQQHEKVALVELNQRFSPMLVKLYRLETQNSKFMAEIDELRRQEFIKSINGKEAFELYRLEGDVRRLNYDKVGYESDIERFQLQVEVYHKLDFLQQNATNEKRLKLEQELSQSSTTLAELCKSYATSEQHLESLRKALKDHLRMFMTSTEEWSTLRRKTKELKFDIKMVNVQIQFFKSVYSKVDGFCMDMSDFDEFWKSEWQNIVKKIRRDFELVYGAILQETICYYEKKREEAKVELECVANIQNTEHLELIQALEKLETEVTKAQKTHSHEKEALAKTEALYAELVSELNAMRAQRQEVFDTQSSQFEYLNEKMVEMASSFEEMERKKISLENEVIIYRHLSGESEVKKTIEANTNKMRTYLERNEVHGSIKIEASLDRGYITLTNQSTNKTVDLSKWQVLRRIDSKVSFNYVIPDGIQIKPTDELRIYSKSAIDYYQMHLENGGSSSSVHGKLVLDVAYSMGIGEVIQTQLLDEYGKEIAICVQTAQGSWFECN